MRGRLKKFNCMSRSNHLSLQSYISLGVSGSVSHRLPRHQVKWAKYPTRTVSRTAPGSAPLLEVIFRRQCSVFSGWCLSSSQPGRDEDREESWCVWWPGENEKSGERLRSVVGVCSTFPGQHLDHYSHERLYWEALQDDGQVISCCSAVVCVVEY